MEKSPSELPLYLRGKKLNIKNYPFFICPKCASVRIKRKDMRKTVTFLRKQGDKIPFLNDLRFS
jgi:hypothetical protein